MKPIIKNILYFVAGVVTTVLVLFLIAWGNNSDGFSGLTVFPEKGECLNAKQIEVFQVLESNVALANICEFKYGMETCIGGVTILLLNDDGKHYYDDEIIKIPAKKCARQIGTYRYTTKKDNFEKVVPAVVIE